ncbi:RCC1 domain-containing protein RUG3, mitochondrial isoform X2 [Punica granatum]|uniref:RCC1 domain-containing protein RUG3, mitochondrial isoform X2 n=1 Tax=Punica granatum TaxID=22663 RepID=A0A6P8BZJ4_PUNGR|nr:RCC1 domain-containing protein RUG3, mitochondrial isoform X2 [Punica granatum]
MSFLRRRLSFLTRRQFSSSPPLSSSSSAKVPLLYEAPEGTAAVNVQLYSWGRGSSGQLGGGVEEIRIYPAPVANLLLPRSFTLSPIPGKLRQNQKGSDSPPPSVCRGYGGFGALGHSVYHRELLPRLVEGSWDGAIWHIATSGTHTAAVTQSGELYTWGREEGDGRLGLGPGRGPDQTGGLSIPSKVKALPVAVVSVSCGGFFTMALTEEGQVWNWGANANYELGRGNKVGGWQPKPIPSLENVRISQIASGGYHSLALTDDGNVLSWGHGGHGQLGHCSIQSQKEPQVIETLANERVISIACGGSSSAAVTDKGKLYMWGNGKDAQLGVPGLAELQPCPKEVKFLVEDDGLEPHNVLSVAIGASHTLCLVSRTAF